MARPYKVRFGKFVGIMAVAMAGFMTALYIIPASFSAALVWQEWVVVGAWMALGAFFYIYSKRRYGAEFGRDVYIRTEEDSAETGFARVVRKQTDTAHFVLTIGCEYGSGGPEIGKMIADHYGIEYYNRDLVDKVVKELGVDKELVEEADMKKDVRYGFDTSYGVRYANLSNRVIDAQFKAIHDFAEKSSCVIIGRSSDFILHDRDDVINVFIYASEEEEISAVMAAEGLGRKAAAEKRQQYERAQHARHLYITGRNRGDRRSRDILINSSMLGWEATADFIISIIDRKFGESAEGLRKEA